MRITELKTRWIHAKGVTMQPRELALILAAIVLIVIACLFRPDNTARAVSAGEGARVQKSHQSRCTRCEPRDRRPAPASTCSAQPRNCRTT